MGTEGMNLSFRKVWRTLLRKIYELKLFFYTIGPCSAIFALCALEKYSRKLNNTKQYPSDLHRHFELTTEQNQTY